MFKKLLALTLGLALTATLSAAAITKTVALLGTYGDKGHVVTWASITAASTFADGDKYESPGRCDRSVQAVGTFTGGISVGLVGSNDGTNWFALHDVGGNVVTFTSAGLVQIEEITRYVKPVLTVAGSGSSVTLTLLARGNDW